MNNRLNLAAVAPTVAEPSLGPPFGVDVVVVVVVVGVVGVDGLRLSSICGSGGGVEIFLIPRRFA